MRMIRGSYLQVMSHLNASCHMPTGWRRHIGSPKLQIIFHKRATKYRSLLQKMTCKDKGSYESSPPCIIRWQLHTSQWAMSQSTSHVTHEKNHVTLMWVISRTNESCLDRMRHVTYARDMSHARKNHVTLKWVTSRTNESCHVRMRHVTYARDMSRKKESGHVKRRSLQKECYHVGRRDRMVCC